MTTEQRIRESFDNYIKDGDVEFSDFDSFVAGYLACDENNNVSVVDTISRSEIAKFGGNKMTISKIVFVNENEFLVSSDDKIINLYSVK